MWLAAGLLGCDEPLKLPPLLRDPGDRVGSSWFLCDSSIRQKPEDAVHHKGIVARLHHLFPPGSSGTSLQDELVRQKFAIRECSTDPAIRIATYRWKERWGGQGLIAFKVDQDDKIIWTTGFNSYGGP